jgi:DNA-binding NarL/FixJ family response regulator
MTYLELVRRIPLLLFPLFVFAASLADIVADLSQGSTTAHLAQELLLLIAALAVSVWLVLKAWRSQRRLAELRAQLAAMRAAPAPESVQLANARRELANAIRDQFAQWQLTPSEQEIGQLLLKGFSLKEIAHLRGTAEKTIRQQASSLYQKAGVSGRHTFAAWFLEDLL